MDDERLENPPGTGQRDYFDDVLKRTATSAVHTGGLALRAQHLLLLQWLRV
jgi:hypothetical protein